MAMIDKVTINSTDVTDYRITWDVDEEWETSIDVVSVKLSQTVDTVLTPIEGDVVVITRGFTTSTDEAVITAQITQVKPELGTYYILECKGAIYEAVKAGRTKSWDKDIDTEAGVGSEIFKSVADNSGLAYDSSSITSTGTADSQKIVKLVQNDEDDYLIMNRLAKRYNYIITYDYDNSLINFKPKGFITYGKTLLVGTDIPGQIKWKKNMEQMVNKVKIIGATVLDTIQETFAGPSTTISLSKTPESTEVRINYATTNDLQTRGQKDIGILGTDFDYYVDVEQKSVIFASNKSDIFISYTAQVPMPILSKNQTSIDKYGGPNKTPHFKRFTFPDLKDVADAEAKSEEILNTYSTPFNEALNVPIKDSIIQTYGNIKPGYLIRIEDPFNNTSLNLHVKGVRKSYPHINDKITVGDEIWRTEDWQAVQMEKMNQLFNELNKNQDILISTFDAIKEKIFERRYLYLEEKDRSSDSVDTFILGHPTFGKLGTQELGDAGTSWSTVKITQGKNTYKEYGYDTTFYDSVNSTGITWNTTLKTITFSASGILFTEALTKGTQYIYATFNSGNITSGSIIIEISANGKTDWQTLAENTRTVLTNTDSTEVYLRITAGGSGAVIENTKNIFGEFIEPSLELFLEV